MKINIGGRWYQNALRTKRQGGWIAPKDAFVKTQGVWTPFRHTDVIRTNNIRELIADTNGWINDPERGWFYPIYHSVQDVYPPFVSTLNPTILSLVRKVSATFTSYYDIPAGGLNLNYLQIHLDDGSVWMLGTNDRWAHGPSGQNIYKGDAGNEERRTRNVINERYTYTIPAGRKVTNIEFVSYPPYTSGIRYPMTHCGMKDFEFILG